MDILELQEAIDAEDLDQVRALLDAGAEIYETEEEVATHDAADSNCAAILELLLSRRANLEAKNLHGNTALHIAAENGSVAAMRVLLQRRANINACDKWSATPLHVAAHGGKQHAVQLLLEQCADTSTKLDLSSLTREDMSKFPNWANLDGMTALEVAEQVSKAEVVALLAEPPLVLTVRAQQLPGGLGFKVSATTMSGREVAVVGWPVHSAEGLAATLRANLQRSAERPSRVVRFLLPSTDGQFLKEDLDLATLTSPSAPEVRVADHPELQAEQERLRREWLELEESRAALEKEKLQLIALKAVPRNVRSGPYDGRPANPETPKRTDLLQPLRHYAPALLAFAAGLAVRGLASGGSTL